jgi:hypothetical protein
VIFLVKIIQNLHPGCSWFQGNRNFSKIIQILLCKWSDLAGLIIQLLKIELNFTVYIFNPSDQTLVSFHNYCCGILDPNIVKDNIVYCNGKTDLEIFDIINSKALLNILPLQTEFFKPSQFCYAIELEYPWFWMIYIIKDLSVQKAWSEKYYCFIFAGSLSVDCYCHFLVFTSFCAISYIFIYDWLQCSLELIKDVTTVWAI